MPSKKHNLRPLHNFVLLDAPDQQVSAGGIQIPQTVQHEKDRGIVTAVGPGLYDAVTGQLRPMSVKVGDKIWYRAWAELVLDGQKYIVVQESDIIAVVEPT